MDEKKPVTIDYNQFSNWMREQTLPPVDRKMLRRGHVMFWPWYRRLWYRVKMAWRKLGRIA